MSQLRIGTCSWKYDSWRGLVYSDNSKINYLKEYSSQYNTVEVDQWFWSLNKGEKVSLPKQIDVASYNSSVPDDFKFSVKLPNSLTLTHHYRNKKSEPLIENPFFFSNELMNNFMNRVDLLGNKLGPLMMQFEYLSKEKMPSLNEFLLKLGEFWNKTNNKIYWHLKYATQII